MLVCVSYGWTDEPAIRAALDAFPAEETVIIQGGPAGVDNPAAEIARERGMQCVTYALTPLERGIFGRQAPQIVAMRMLEDGKPDRVLAFRRNRSSGISHIIREARKRGTPVTVIDQESG